MSPIASYVFMHLETTGLPSLESNQTRITELSMVVLKRKHMKPNSSGQLPRIKHELTMAFKPDKEITEGAAKLSGLSEDLLNKEPFFNSNACATIKTFLECQEKPVCLLAHNGHKFSFPLLKYHFERCNMSLPEDLKCVDSRQCFYELIKDTQKYMTGDRDPCREKTIDEVLASPYYKKEHSQIAKHGFSVTGIYNRVFNHTANNRSIMIAQIAVALSPEFMNVVDSLYCSFLGVKAQSSALHFLH